MGVSRRQRTGAPPRPPRPLQAVGRSADLAPSARRRCTPPRRPGAAGARPRSRIRRQPAQRGRPGRRPSDPLLQVRRAGGVGQWGRAAPDGRDKRRHVCQVRRPRRRGARATVRRAGGRAPAVRQHPDRRGMRREVRPRESAAAVAAVATAEQPPAGRRPCARPPFARHRAASAPLRPVARPPLRRGRTAPIPALAGSLATRPAGGCRLRRAPAGGRQSTRLLRIPASGRRAARPRRGGETRTRQSSGRASYALCRSVPAPHGGV